MIYLPNKFELFSSKLRNTTQILIIKNGIRKKYLNNLRKIDIAEALYSKQSEPLNVGEFSFNLLNAVKFKKHTLNQKFDFNVNIKDTRILNKKLFSSILLTLCASCKSINIYSKNEILVIKAKLNNKITFKKIPNYFILQELNNNNIIIIINAKKTDKKPKPKKADREYLCDPLSLVNIYII